MTESNNNQKINLELLKKSAELIYTQFEELGGEAAKSARLLRDINSQLIEHAAVNSGYYSQFTDQQSPKTIEAILLYLYAAGEPKHRKTLARDLIDGGYKYEAGIPKPIIESIYFQVKGEKNGNGKLIEKDGLISLTKEGRDEAKTLISVHGPPPKPPKSS